MRVRPINIAARDRVRIAESPEVGFSGLVKVVESLVESRGNVTIGVDGMWGVKFDELAGTVATLFPGGRVEVISTLDAVRAAEELHDIFDSYLTDNPVFGRVCDLPLSAYFDEHQLASLRQSLAGKQVLFRNDGTTNGTPAKSETAVTFLIGPGALLDTFLPVLDLRIYWDLTREEITERQKAGLRNFGDSEERSPGDKYKRAYYVEWPIFEQHKRQVLGKIDYYVDGNGEEPIFLSRQLLQGMIEDVASKPFRCKPYFQPGVWGGQRLKEVAGLSPSLVNCAWDFEIVAPENSILIKLDDDETVVNIPFPLLMWQNSRQILGPQGEKDFGTFFPIRINYLDTMDGTNLSCQVHPHDSYIRQRFNEPIAQNESYYVVENKPGSKVYLGFRNTTNRENFAAVVRKAEEEYQPFDVADYVNEWDAEQGDYFLIPAGTVHCSGKDNLVLEISTTPYWYAFKLYDYLRPDLNGKPRPINSSYGFEVLDFTRTTEWVKTHLIPVPRLIREEPGGREEVIGSTYLAFHAANRLTVVDEMQVDPQGSVEMVILVKGDRIRLVLDDDPAWETEIRYLETFVVPAAAGPYRSINDDATMCQVVRVYLKQ